MEVTYRDPREIRQRVDELLDHLQLTHKRNIQAGKLSRGEQQRVAIASAAANAPPLLLADEPTGNLDAGISELVMSLFEKLNRDGSTLIIASHDESIYHNTRHRKWNWNTGFSPAMPCTSNCRLSTVNEMAGIPARAGIHLPRRIPHGT